MKIRILSHSWFPGRVEVDGAVFSADFTPAESDGLLTLYDPCIEMLEFQGPRLWYTIEPQWHAFWRSGDGAKLLSALRSDEYAYYAHPDPDFRVPHITTNDDFSTESRLAAPVVNDRAVAVVSNFGGRAWFTRRNFRQRNAFITHPGVDLHGRMGAWSRFRHWPALWRVGLPDNYRAIELPESTSDLIRFMSRWRVAVCLENSVEPHYFTEKFVNAVRAGCIPIYAAHPSVRSRFLQGARWIDPAEFGFDPAKTLAKAFSSSQDAFREANDRWLTSGAIEETRTDAFWRRIAKIFTRKIEAAR